MIQGRRNHKRVILSLLVILILTVTAFQVFKRPAVRLFGDFFSGYLAIPAQTEALISGTAESLKSRQFLMTENAKLRRENERLWSASHELESLRNQHAALRKLLNLPPLQHFKYIRGQVILRDPTSWDTTLTIGIGARDGVRPGYPVLSVAPLRGTTTEQLTVIGRVASTSEHTAVIYTLVHPESNLSVFLPKSSVAAMLRGGFVRGTETRLDMFYLPRVSQLTPSEVVQTSGLSPMTPEGLFVGYVTPDEKGQLQYSDNNLDCSAYVLSGADLSNLRYVVVPVPERAVMRDGE